MKLKAFSFRSRKVYANAVLDETHDTVRSARGHRVAREKFVLMPPIGLDAADGSPVYLGDAFTRTVDGRLQTFIVGPLPAPGELVKEFHLRGYKSEDATDTESMREGLELTPDVMATLERAGNVYENPEKFVPNNESYCYKGLGWDGQFYHIVLCPFWTRSDHGMTYCRLTQRGSLSNKDEDFRKAVAHFGSEDAVHAADTDWLLWDQVKSCGVNDVDDLDDEPDSD